MDGNMTYRTDASGSYSQTFDVQNRLIVVTDTQTLSVTQFLYDGDGNRVLAIYPDQSQTAYAGEHYEEQVPMNWETTTLQPSSSGVDSYVDQENPNSNYWMSSSLLVAGHVVQDKEGGEGEPTRLKHFLLQFDLSSIPAEAAVDEAVLTLYCAKSEDETERSIDFYRVIRGPSPSTVAGSWTEPWVTWKCAACWERSEQCNKPSAFFGSAISIDLGSTELEAYTLSLTSLVQNWVSGNWANRGVMAKMALAEAGYDEAYCVSSDGETSSQRPKLEVDWHAEEDSIYRSYYYLGGRRIALRVEEGAEDDVYWLHTDHLGSTSLLSTITGTLVSGTTTRFLPFGDYRTEPDSDLTDRGFTGHAQNDPLGLIYMRARYYVASVGRFASADTIIPNPANPQSWNRFSYVNNNPLKYRDPSGHALECGLLGEGCGGELPSPLWPPNEEIYDTGRQDPIHVELYNDEFVAEVIVMPLYSHSIEERSDFYKRVGSFLVLCGWGADIMELLQLVATPFIPDEDLVAWGDFAATFFADFFRGESYIAKPHPALPNTLVIGQDTLVNLGDAIIGQGATWAQLIVLPVLGPAAAYGEKLVIDGTSTALSFAYDSARITGDIPAYLNLGFYIDDGRLHIAILYYPQSTGRGQMGFK